MCRVSESQAFHLNVGVRSFRAQTITQWVNSVIQGDSQAARQHLGAAIGGFPLVITRDLEKARAWLQDRARSEHRCGLLVSSGSIRHRAYGIEVSSGFRKGFTFDEWFLASPEDVRSSYQLEIAATEFECQGLELDWVGLCWGDDLTWDAKNSSWRSRHFRGNRWVGIRQAAAQSYLLNKYRVLLTRAREGMVIWVPPGSQTDATRNRSFLDATNDFLAAAGAPTL
jgi:hypothetical protein